MPSRIGSERTDSISPTNPRSGSLTSFVQDKTSFPGIRRTPQSWEETKEATSSLTSPFKTSSTTRMVSLSVTLNPSMKFASIPCSANFLVTAFPPPCTTTTLIPTKLRKTKSRATPALTSGSGESMKLPPYLTTKMDPRKRLT